jgi:hypothetical protein
MRSMTLPDITTVAAIFPNTRVGVLMAGTHVTVEAVQGPNHATITLDTVGRRALIVALGGLPTECADSMLATVTAEDRAEVERLTELMATAASTLEGELDPNPLVPFSFSTLREVVAQLRR